MEILRKNSVSISSEERQCADEDEELKRDSRALKENDTSMSREERSKEGEDKKLRRANRYREEMVCR